MGKKMRSVVVFFVLIAASIFVSADELKDLSSADVATPVAGTAENKVANKEEESNLGESTGFSGALMTSGSFTMMAGTGMEEEEGELGESTGFSGALMTSGSFTMMAGTGME